MGLQRFPAHCLDVTVGHLLTLTGPRMFPNTEWFLTSFPVQRASFFAASDENHRPLSAASNSDQLEDQALAQMKSYGR